jgi:hypothetical protein
MGPRRGSRNPHLSHTYHHGVARPGHIQEERAREQVGVSSSSSAAAATHLDVLAGVDELVVALLNLQEAALQCEVLSGIALLQLQLEPLQQRRG